LISVDSTGITQFIDGFILRFRYCLVPPIARTASHFLKFPRTADLVADFTLLRHEARQLVDQRIVWTAGTAGGADRR
jgi:hypothetical protein